MGRGFFYVTFGPAPRRDIVKTFNIKELREWESWFEEELENLTDNMCRMYGISVESKVKGEIVKVVFDTMDKGIRLRGDDFEV